MWALFVVRIYHVINVIDQKIVKPYICNAIYTFFYRSHMQNNCTLLKIPCGGKGNGEISQHWFD